MMSTKKNSKTNIALLATIGATLTIGYGTYKTNEKVNIMEETYNKTQKEIRESIKEIKNDINSYTNKIEESIKQKEEREKEIEETNNKIKRLEEKVRNNEINIKKLEATNLNLSVSRGMTTRSNSNTTQALKENKGTPVEIVLTFYGEGAHENGGYAGIDAQGNRLVAGTVASNYYKFGTKIRFNNQEFTVNDRGGSSFNSPNRLDVFVPRRQDESDKEYKTRISNYGKKKVIAYIG